jgi:hypothetical protein
LDRGSSSCLREFVTSCLRAFACLAEARVVARERRQVVACRDRRRPVTRGPPCRDRDSPNARTN